MFALSLRFLVNDSILPNTVLGPGLIVNFSSKTYFNCDLPLSIHENPEHFCPRWIDFKGTQYVSGMVLILGVDEFRSFQFVEILFIVPDENKVFFLCSLLVNVGLNSHIRGYEIEKPLNSKNLPLVWVNSDSLFHAFPFSIHSIANGEKYITEECFL